MPVREIGLPLHRPAKIGVRFSHSFDIQKLGQTGIFGAVHDALHQAEGDLRALRKGPSELHRVASRS
jgi:hypothetical protein